MIDFLKENAQKSKEKFKKNSLTSVVFQNLEKHEIFCWNLAKLPRWPKLPWRYVFFHSLCIFHLQDTQRKLQNITKEACYFLSRTEKVKVLASQLGILTSNHVTHTIYSLWSDYMDSLLLLSVLTVLFVKLAPEWYYLICIFWLQELLDW